jgi:hypothetical protein
MRAFGAGCSFAFLAVLLASYVAGDAACAVGSVDPLDIFAEHAAAVGYSLADGRAKPYVLEASVVDTDTGKASTLRRKQAGAYFVVAQTSNSRTGRYGFDGHGFWNQNENGNVTYEIGYERQYDIAWAVIDAEAFGPDLMPEVVDQSGDDYVIRIHPPNAVPADVYFNKKTYLIDRAVVSPALVPQRREYSDYEHHGPTMVAMTWSSNGYSGKVTKFQWDAPMPASDFDRPPQRIYATFPAAGPSVVSFDDKNDSITFAASINGVQGRFELDSGADGVYLTPSFAARAHLTPLDQSSASWVGGTFAISPTRVAHLTVGGVDFSDFYALIGAKADVDGFIGYDILAQVVCDINFDKKQLALINPASYQGDPRRGSIVFALDTGTPQIQALINQKHNVYMELDTGDSSSMTFARTFVDANPGVVARGAEVRFVGGGGESQSGYIGTLDEIDIGPYKFFGLEADVLGGFKGFASSRLRQGLVGYQMLRRFNLTFDYRDNKVYLELSKYGSETRFK